jgi:DNA-binding response OmpR family regulator
MENSATKRPPIVLVVEDEALLRLNATIFLKDAGFETIEASNASDALKIMKSRPDVGVLFTDIQMPGLIDGMELAREIHEGWPDVLLLITSGNRRPAKATIPDHGHFLAKPYGAAAVIGEIHALVREAASR